MALSDMASAALLAAALCSPVSQLHAETLAELDALSDAAQNEAAAVAAAQDLAARGAYLEALATLERMLAIHPKSLEGRLLHALYTCRIDDRRGGGVAIGKLKEKEFGSQTLDDARTACESREDAR